MSAIQETQDFWLRWIDKQFRPDEVSNDVVQKGLAMIEDDCDYWSNHPMWDLFNSIKQ